MSVFVHLGLGVTDMARAERFYAEAFGFVRDRELRLTGGQINALLQVDPVSDIHAVYLVLGPFTLELIAFDPPCADTARGRVFNQTGFAHISIAVDDVSATLARVQALGGVVLTHIGRAAVLRDPDGALIEVLDMAVKNDIDEGRPARALGKG